MKKNIHLIVAARPNIMKLAPLYHALHAQNWAYPKIIHTGQHYDDNMSGIFFREFGLPTPHHHLGDGTGSYAQQAANTMLAYESLCAQDTPDLCIVFGDVNAAMACAVTAKKAHVPLAHIEAGLRSFDRRMPEEINRLAIDSITDWFFTPSPDATQNLIHEGHTRAQIFETGNLMIDAYELRKADIDASKTAYAMNLSKHNYSVATFHRASNVDNQDAIENVVSALEIMAQAMPVVFPAHPRTKNKLQAFGFLKRLQANENIRLCEPMPYSAFMNLITQARLVATDSGGLQEETSYLGIPCITLRENTERPITCTQGTNTLVAFENFSTKFDRAINTPFPIRPTIKGWDGQAAMRVTKILYELAQVGKF